MRSEERTGTTPASWIGAGACALLSCLAACAADGGSGDGASSASGTPVLPPPTVPLGGASGASVVPLGPAGGAGQSSVPIAPAAGSPSPAGAGGASLPTAGAGGSGGVGAGGMAGAAGAAGTAAGGMAGSSVPSGDLCAQWREARANLDEGPWNGDSAACEAGDMTQEARATAHALHSLYRTMAGLEPVEMTEEGNRLAQECALMMTANGRISHMPDASWKCYSAERADTASSSSLGSGDAISAVDGYMIDPGNPTTLGHRRWVLSNMLASVGFGSTGSFTCQYQPPQRPSGAKAWVAWPPPGQVPIQALGAFFATVDQTGWSVQSDGIDFASAQVTVMAGGASQPVTVTQLSGGYGSRYAMRFNPMGWKAAASQTYHVAISGTSMPIEYDVEVIDCP